MKKMVSAQVRRRQVDYACQRRLSARGACALLSVARSTLRYESRLAAKDAAVVAAMRDLPAQYPRFGYRRIQVLLVRQGHAMSPDRGHRLWRQVGLQVPRRRPRRRISTGRPRPLPPTGIGHVWTYDFVFDACANGQQLKCLTVLDEYIRECLAIDVAGGIRSGIEVLTQLINIHGAPRNIRSDNGLSSQSKPKRHTSEARCSKPSRCITAASVASQQRSSAVTRSPLTIMNTRSAKLRRPSTNLKQRKVPAEGPSIIYEVDRRRACELPAHNSSSRGSVGGIAEGYSQVWTQNVGRRPLGRARLFERAIRRWPESCRARPRTLGARVNLPCDSRPDQAFGPVTHGRCQ